MCSAQAVPGPACVRQIGCRRGLLQQTGHLASRCPPCADERCSERSALVEGRTWGCAAAAAAEASVKARTCASDCCSRPSTSSSSRVTVCAALVRVNGVYLCWLLLKLRLRLHSQQAHRPSSTECVQQPRMGGQCWHHDRGCEEHAMRGGQAHAPAPPTLRCPGLPAAGGPPAAPGPAPAARSPAWPGHPRLRAASAHAGTLSTMVSAPRERAR